MPNLPIADELLERFNDLAPNCPCYKCEDWFDDHQSDDTGCPVCTSSHPSHSAFTNGEVKALIHHYATKRELEAKISAYDLELTFGIDTNEPADYKRGFYDAVEKYDAALNNIQSELKAHKEQENK